jgi:hypothetical protein
MDTFLCNDCNRTLSTKNAWERHIGSRACQKNQRRNIKNSTEELLHRVLDLEAHANQRDEVAALKGQVFKIQAMVKIMQEGYHALYNPQITQALENANNQRLRLESELTA